MSRRRHRSQMPAWHVLGRATAFACGPRSALPHRPGHPPSARERLASFRLRAAQRRAHSSFAGRNMRLGSRTVCLANRLLDLPVPSPSRSRFRPHSQANRECRPGRPNSMCPQSLTLSGARFEPKPGVRNRDRTSDHALASQLGTSRARSAAYLTIAAGQHSQSA